MPARLLRRVSRRLAGRTFAVLIAAPAPLLSAACAARTVEVGTGANPAPASAAIAFTNDLPQAVNVYARIGNGSEIFLRQVAGRSTENVSVRGVREGGTVSLRIAPVDGAAAITRENVTVGQGSAVRVP